MALHKTQNLCYNNENGDGGAQPIDPSFGK